MNLSSEGFKRAYRYMQDTAQDIECAVFEHVIFGKPSENAMGVLEKYQCEDGGFGQLDYDIGYPYSCVKHTESACRHILRLNPPASHAVIQRLVPYLLENYNPDTGEWNNMLVPQVNDYPHPPWWTYQEKAITVPANRNELIKQYHPNTNATLAGILYKYRELVPEKTLDEIVRVPIEKAYTTYTTSPYDMKSMLHFIGALSDGDLKKGLYQAMLDKAEPSMDLDENKWNSSYTVGPGNIITSPDHPFYETYKQAVDHHLDFLISTQQADGSWATDWSWGEPEYWQTVKKKLQGVLTLRFISVLKNFDRIDSPYFDPIKQGAGIIKGSDSLAQAIVEEHRKERQQESRYPPVSS